MKKLYKTPSVRFINLETEGMIAGSVQSDEISIDRSSTSDENTILSNKQNMWDRDGIWK